MENLEKEETTGAGTSSPLKTKIKKRFETKRIAFMAIFVALSYAVSFIEIPLFPAAPFLKLDFGNVFILLVGFLLGPIEGVIVCALKESLRMLSSSSGGVGELANMLVTSSYILLPSVAYRFRKGLKTVIPALVAACCVGTAVALLANRYINFPLYEAFLGMSAQEAFGMLWGVILAFNLIKTLSVSILTIFLYKRLSNFLKKMKF